jgi:glycosyltransferase involved in cell wall biosynthesis
MGQDFPVWVIPAPLFDKHAGASTKPRGWHAPFDLVPDGSLTLSAGDIDLSPFRPDRPPAEGIRALRALERELASHRSTAPRLRLEGVIYTAVLNPFDGRKNWHDMTTGFVWAFRHTATATLVLKLTRFDLEDGLLPVLRHLSTLGPFACRIVLIQGLLSEPAYRALIDATSYAVNTAYGEGQCLPLMEYMSAGRPAVAPAHTAMRDYVSSENAFVIDSEPCATSWPHDERRAHRCLHFRISTADFARKCRESYWVARDDAQKYARMSEAAITSLRAFCSDEVVMARLGEVLSRFYAQDEKRIAFCQPP